MDLGSIMKISQAWNVFKANHPKFPEFVKAVKSNGIHEGTTIDISIRYPDGKILRSGIVVHESDMAFLKTISEINT